ncbi:unnamed protein product [Trifolium pratense]|uniref:Uncharacterized protein n=1 Tax=Trifolium pratense TaxID=57577 RepID=A0ACB0LPS4_TRIPR|nr:unnamed protein product [Trifolium pratense]
MSDNLKFVYILTLFISLFLVVVFGQRECNTDEECHKKFPLASAPMTCYEECHKKFPLASAPMTCYEGYCYFKNSSMNFNVKRN